MQLGIMHYGLLPVNVDVSQCLTVQLMLPPNDANLAVLAAVCGGQCACIANVRRPLVAEADVGRRTLVTLL